MVNDKLSDPSYKKKRIVHFTSLDDNKRANAVFLVASYAVIYLRKAPEEVYHELTSPSLPPLKSFQDASLKFSNYTINLLGKCYISIIKHILKMKTRFFHESKFSFIIFFFRLLARYF